ncbi:hypothetical protein [Streptomyces smyrnaeus]|uniref:hypothetical protein n=1 Tax=Streptomyces smyrnaeus TaxID=1387713 RepID=UPI00340E0144
MSAMYTVVDRVWVATPDETSVAYRLVDPRPVVADDEHGHVWRFDGGASDPDDPYGCVLCGRARWQALGKPCEDAGKLAVLNEKRVEHVRRHLVDGTPPGAVAGRDEVYRKVAA